MKCKKILALVMAAVLSVSMLTACGGGGGGGSLNTGKVNSMIDQAGSEIKVTAPSELRNAVSSTAKELVQSGAYRNSALATTKLNSKMETPALGLMATSGRFCMAYIVSERDIETGGEASAMASMLGIGKTNMGNLGWVDTPEGVAAAIVLGIDGGIDTYINRLLSIFPAKATVSADYAICATKMTGSNETNYWLFGVEVSASWATKKN